MGGSWRNYQRLNEVNQGNFHGTPFEEILAVVISDTYDAQNRVAEIRCLEPEYLVMKGIDWKITSKPTISKDFGGYSVFFPVLIYLEALGFSSINTFRFS